MGYTRVIRSGNLIEVYKYERTLEFKNRGTKRKAAVRNRADVIAKRRRPDNVYRLRKKFIRIVHANIIGDENPAFVSFTMFKVVPFKQAVQCFSGFVKRLRQRVGKDFRYICVPEFQERGAVHFHVLIWGLPFGYVDEIQVEGTGKVTAEHLQETVFRRLQHLWARGTVDSIRTDGSARIAGYMAKYMSKSMQDVRLGGEKAYYCSGNCLRPMSVASNTVIDFLDDILPDDIQLLHSRSYRLEYLGKVDYQKYSVQ